MGRARRVWFLTVLCFGIVITACDNTPTVPLPPPEMVVDNVEIGGSCDGYSEVVGEPGCVEDDALVIIFNEVLNEGVTVEADTDGSFSAIVRARPKDILSIRQVVEHIISGTTYYTVPDE